MSCCDFSSLANFKVYTCNTTQIGSYRQFLTCKECGTEYKRRMFIMDGGKIASFIELRKIQKIDLENWNEKFSLQEGMRGYYYFRCDECGELDIVKGIPKRSHCEHKALCHTCLMALNKRQYAKLVAFPHQEV